MNALTALVSLFATDLITANVETITNSLIRPMLTIYKDRKLTSDKSECFGVYATRLLLTHAEWLFLNNNSISFRDKSDLIVRAHLRTHKCKTINNMDIQAKVLLHLTEWENNALASDDVLFAEKSNIVGRGRQRFIHVGKGGIMDRIQQTRNLQWSK